MEEMSGGTGNRQAEGGRRDWRKTLVLVPAYNEEASLPGVLREIAESLPGAGVAVVDDGSQDATASVAAAGGATVLRLPCNMGVGPALQAGMRWAVEEGYELVLRLDADGQHIPAEAEKLREALEREGTDLAIGTRYGDGGEYRGSWGRRLVLAALAGFLSAICRKRTQDPTSGFWLMTRDLAECFLLHYPSDYPEPEAVALMRRQGFDFTEVPTRFRTRKAGESSLGPWKTFNFAAKVFLALFVDRLRSVDRRGSASDIRRRRARREAKRKGKGA